MGFKQRNREGQKEATHAIFAEVAKYALSLPGAYEEFPWGERTAKVDKKVFAFLGPEHAGFAFAMSVKLPQSGDFALSLPGASPTAYNLGRAGWVSFRFSAAQIPPLELLCQFLLESYRAVASKKRLAELSQVL